MALSIKTIEHKNRCLNPGLNIDAQYLCDLVGTILVQANKQGADAAEIDFAVSSGSSLNVRRNEVEVLDHSYGKDLGITVYFGKKTGTATTSNLHVDAIQLMLEKACHIAKFTNEDPYVGLAPAERMAYNYPDLDLYHPWDIATKDAIAFAKECEQQAFAVDKRIINSEGCRLSSNQSFYIYANTHGFLGKTYATRHSFGTTLIAAENDKMQSDTYYTIAHDFRDLESLHQVATKAGTRTINKLNPQHISTRQCPVILHAEIASNLLADFISAISGGNLYRKASFLLDHLGKQIFPKTINIDERPLLSKALGSAPFDGEGVAIAQSDIVTDGILRRYVLDSYSARKLGLETTGNSGGVYNLFINTENFGLEKLLQKMDTGLLVTDLLGDGVNIITGDFSRGVFGYWVEKGEIQYPVEGVTIAGNLRNMFSNLVAVANDIDIRGNIITGSILLDEMILGGN